MWHVLLERRWRPGFKPLPLVEAMRLLALCEEIAAESTLERMESLKEKGVLGDEKLDDLSGAFRHITYLLLRQQLADFKAGKKVGNHVHPDSLSDREKDILGFRRAQTHDRGHGAHRAQRGFRHGHAAP